MDILYMALVVLGVILFILIIILFWLIIKDKKTKVKNVIEEKKIGQPEKNERGEKQIDKESIYKFMEFDEIKDDMIIRKNRFQYVMVLKCKGVNYDLMSEEEKMSVESGFVQFLNALRFPIQLYVQTTSLNFRNIIEEYQTRIAKVQSQLKDVNVKINEEKLKGTNKNISKLEFERRRIQNVLEYTVDIAEYIARMNTNKNILQQKTYVIVSYFSSEADNTENLNKQELDSVCFSELYTRTQTIMRSLTSAGVVSKILDSEELAELLYVAYNRDESEIMRLSSVLNSQYDALYSTGKDVLEKKKENLESKLEIEAIDLTAESIEKAGEKIREQKEIEKKSIEILGEYKDQMNEEIYEEAKKQISQKTIKNIKKIEDTKEKNK